MTLTLEHIQAAAGRIAGATVNTPFAKSVTLSDIAGCEVYNKFENHQFTASFKDRGALNKLLLLQQEGGTGNGVVTASAGNHAKALAYHSKRLGIPTTIVMPVNTPNVKVQDTKDLGARVVLDGGVLDEAAVRANELVDKEGLVYVHPFDDWDIMAGQGTVALEMLEREPDLEAVIAPVGGGGLIAGMATAAKTLNPRIKIYGVEVAGYPSVRTALGLGERREGLGGRMKSWKGAGKSGGKGAGKSGRLATSTTIAEGIAVKQPGKRSLEVIERLVDDIFIVDESAIEDAINLYLVIEKTVSEGAGAAALAAVLGDKKRFKGLKAGLVLSGANIDSRILASVLMRRLVKRGSIVQFIVEIDDSPGSLSEVSSVMSEFGGNILDVSHQRMFADLPVKRAELLMTVETRDASQIKDITARLEELGYNTRLKDIHA